MEDYIIEECSECHVRISPAPKCAAEMTEEVKACMIRQAANALQNSYAPYSHYNVAAAVLMSSGRIYTGVNVESALLSCTICAERNAIFHAVSRGENKIIAIAVVGGMYAADQTADFEDYCTPCGVCRQVMRDFSDPKTMTIIAAKSETDYREWTLEQMLPESFGPETIS